VSVKVGFAFTGSFCTFSSVIKQIPILLNEGFEIIPIMSEISYSTDTRFGDAGDFIKTIEQLTGKKIIHTISEAEPIGSQKLLDILVIAPCTGNTIGKLANGITDTSVTMAAKAHLRNQKPLVIAVSSNDALGASARNIGQLLNAKNIYFVPFRQDNFAKKPTSMVAETELILPTIYEALEGRQLEPIII
jgi:dipicolinate synthase subunit B